MLAHRRDDQLAHAGGYALRRSVPPQPADFNVVSRAVAAAHEPADAAAVLLDPGKSGTAKSKSPGLHQRLDQKHGAQRHPQEQKAIRRRDVRDRYGGERVETQTAIMMLRRSPLPPRRPCRKR